MGVFMAYLTNKGVLVPMRTRMDYLAAREKTRDKGGLPSAVLLDRYASGPGHISILVPYYFPALARELVAYPETDGRFKRKNDIVDPHPDKKGRLRIIPWSAVVKFGLGDDILGPRVGLLIDPGIGPEGVKVEKFKGGAVVYHPVSAEIVHPFLQRNRNAGLADDRLGIPVGVHYKVWNKVPEPEVRLVYRLRSGGIRTLVYGIANRAQRISMSSDHDFEYGVATVDLTKERPTSAQEVSRLKIAHRSGQLVISASDEVLRAVREVIESHTFHEGKVDHLFNQG